MNPVTSLLAWRGGRTALTEQLVGAFAEKHLRLATFFGGAELVHLIPDLGAGAEPTAKVVRTLTRYYFRAAARETPFGLFAGISLGRIGAEDRFELAASAFNRRRTSLAPSFFHASVLGLSAREDVRDTLTHELNPTLAVVHGAYRYVARVSSAASAGRWVHSAVELRPTPVLEQVVALAAEGLTPLDLVDALTTDGRPRDRVLEFVRTLCERQLLIPTWLQAATGGRPPPKAVDSIVAEHPTVTEAEKTLGLVLGELELADTEGAEQGADRYREARRKLLATFGPEHEGHALRAELVKPAPNLCLSETLAAKFLAAATLIQRTSPSFQDFELAAFRGRFTERYGDRLVPLAEALDSDAGLGFGRTRAPAADALLAGIFARARPSTRDFDAHDQIKAGILERVLTQGESVYELDAQTLERFALAPSAEFPESFAVLARLSRGDGTDLSIVEPCIVAPSPATILGRFCEAAPDLDAALRRHLAEEQELDRDAVFADVAYFPVDSSANVAGSPSLREYEIRLTGGSSVARDRQIRVADLDVTVENDRVLLYSRRLGKRIKVRPTNAHNFQLSSCPPVYRFLGALQLQDRAGLSHAWSWGAFEDAARLPRLTHATTVLSLARWRLSRAELGAVRQASGAGAFDRVQELRQAHRLPRWVARSHGDERMLVDLDNELSVEELLHSVGKGSSELVLEEFLPTPDSVVLHGPEGGFAAEFIVPFLRRYPTAAVPSASPSAGAAHADVSRRHVPGSEWLYVKLYAGRMELDSILSCIRGEIVSPLLGSSIESWFYLPYGDPDSHLRVRFKGEPARLLAEVLPPLQRALQPFLRSGTLWRFQLDTYEQEVERYGGSMGVGAAERLFSADSDASSELIELCGDDHQLRWQLTLLGIDRLLRDFGFDLRERARFARDAADGYGREVDADTSTWKAIGVKYREFVAVLDAILWDTPGNGGAHAGARAILDRRSDRVGPLWREIQERIRAGTIRANSIELASSFAHLHAVRVLGASARLHELLLYEFLKRQYAARAARGEDTHAAAAVTA
jgi:lantibiotic biosynthesis protein